MDSLNHITNQLNNTIFKFRVEENIQSIIWKKAIANCVFNSICPLLDTDNGIFLRNVEIMNLGQTVIKECVNIANLSGVEISENEVIESVKMIELKISQGAKPGHGGILPAAKVSKEIYKKIEISLIKSRNCYTE